MIGEPFLCPDCKPQQTCQRHLWETFARPRQIRCPCCKEIGCDCEIGAITDVWLKSRKFTGNGVICVTHVRLLKQ